MPQFTTKRAVRHAAAEMFDLAFRRFAAAFERRADDVYGRNLA